MVVAVVILVRDLLCCAKGCWMKVASTLHTAIGVRSADATTAKHNLQIIHTWQLHVILLHNFLTTVTFWICCCLKRQERRINYKSLVHKRILSNFFSHGSNTYIQVTSSYWRYQYDNTFINLSNILITIYFLQNATEFRRTLPAFKIRRILPYVTTVLPITFTGNCLAGKCA